MPVRILSPAAVLRKTTFFCVLSVVSEPQHSTREEFVMRDRHTCHPAEKHCGESTPSFVVFADRAPPGVP
ncbi:hypothetical protein E2C01_048703 [Portunus trituberculatus]|uniref:Uncharacterized protein n=1 Tax=Portunus trituberculatus TaxID=210409 RepID=A0A5B7GBP9_PORTR|nr:hypothetical protein [Portunus trituberculatus]